MHEARNSSGALHDELDYSKELQVRIRSNIGIHQQAAAAEPALFLLVTAVNEKRSTPSWKVRNSTSRRSLKNHLQTQSIQNVSLREEICDPQDAQRPSVCLRSHQPATRRLDTLDYPRPACFMSAVCRILVLGESGSGNAAFIAL
jgi:hypothetical protein